MKKDKFFTVILILLNNNMRCFEILAEWLEELKELRLNNNMRCFEIQSVYRMELLRYVKQ